MCGLRPGRRNDRYGCESDRRRNRRLIDLSKMILSRAEKRFHRSASMQRDRRAGHAQGRRIAQLP